VLRAEIVRRALLAEARAQGFDHDPMATAAIDSARDDALVRLWVQKQTSVPAGYPNEEEIKSAYQTYQAALTPAPEYNLAQIFISAPDGAEPGKLTAAFKKAADVASKMATVDFAVLAQQQSEQPETAAKGGDLGYLPESQLLPEVQAAVRSLKLGESVGPIKTGHGLHFLKLLDKKTSAPPTLAEAHERLASVLRERRAHELEQNYVNSIDTKLAVNVNQIELSKLQASLRSGAAVQN
jgi:parvulin-like peptidyl-prolyl isomerase